MRNALSVRVSSGDNHRTLTKAAADVRFSKQAPGGFFDASFRLNLSARDLRDAKANDRVYFHDVRTGRPIWDGYIKNPTPRSGDAGESWDVSAVGGCVVASDMSMPLVYRDTDLGAWVQSAGSASSAQAQTSDDPTEAVTGQGILAQFNSGQPVGPGSYIGARHHALRDLGTNMTLGALAFTVKSGKTDPNFRNFLISNDLVNPVTTTVVQSSTNINTTPVDHVYWPGIGTAGPFVHPPDGTRLFTLRLYRTGPEGNVNDETTWTFFYNIAVLGRRVDRYGVKVPAGPTGVVSATHVRAHWVVEDLLGRMLRRCDPLTAVVEAGTYPIDQLAYPDGAKAATVLDELVNVYETGMLWEINETLPNGLHRFALRSWPTTPRYLLGSDVDIDRQGSDTEPSNRVLVSYTSVSGARVTRAFGQEVPQLGAGSPVNPDGTPNSAFTGRVRDADPIELPEGRGSDANAALIADQILQASLSAPAAAKVTVGYRVFDRLRNLHVEPHEIEHGHIARLVDTGEDLRLTNVDYHDPTGVASLDLGIPILTLEQRFLQLPLAKR